MDDFTELQVPLAGFEDVTPIPQEDGPDPVVSIAYKHNCECVPTIGFRSTFGAPSAMYSDRVWPCFCAHRVVSSVRTVRDCRAPTPPPRLQPRIFCCRCCIPCAEVRCIHVLAHIWVSWFLSRVDSLVAATVFKIKYSAGGWITKARTRRCSAQ